MFNRLQLLKGLLGKWELVFMLGQAAEDLQQAHNMVERWNIIKPVGDQVAPALDEVIALTKANGLSVMSTEAELEESFLNQFRTAYIDMHVSDVTRSMVLAAGADDETKKKFGEAKVKAESEARAQATEHAKRFDGKWLSSALDLFLKVAPVLLTLLK